MDFQNLIDRALTIRKLYEEKEKQLYGSSWTREEIMLGFVADVGIWQNSSWPKMANVRLKTVKKNWDMKSLIVHGH